MLIFLLLIIFSSAISMELSTNVQSRVHGTHILENDKLNDREDNTSFFNYPFPITPELLQHHIKSLNEELRDQNLSLEVRQFHDKISILLFPHFDDGNKFSKSIYSFEMPKGNTNINYHNPEKFLQKLIELRVNHIKDKLVPLKRNLEMCIDDEIRKEVRHFQILYTIRVHVLRSIGSGIAKSLYSYMVKFFPDSFLEEKKKLSSLKMNLFHKEKLFISHAHQLNILKKLCNEINEGKNNISSEQIQSLQKKYCESYQAYLR